MTEQYYFGFRQTIPAPPGAWVVCGPFHSYDDAMQERQRNKVRDAEVTIVFQASSKAAAQETIAHY